MPTPFDGAFNMGQDTNVPLGLGKVFGGPYYNLNYTVCPPQIVRTPGDTMTTYIQVRNYFQTHVPTEWLDVDEPLKTANRVAFALIYGDKALKIAVETYKVPENIDANFVYTGN
jgi:hypothetical protein